MNNIVIPNSVHKLFRRLFSKQIGFSDVIVICITAISLMVLHNTADSGWLVIWRWVFMLPLLCLTALISNDYDNINNKFTYAWVILTSKLPIDDKYLALKSQLNLIVDKWVTYNRKFQFIVNGDLSADKKAAAITDLIFEIFNGKITVPQGIYIMVYSFYSIVISANMWRVDGPYDVMINIAFITILRYWGGDLKGLSSLLFDFMGALEKGRPNTEREQMFKDIADKMKDDVYASFILDDAVLKDIKPMSVPAPAFTQQVKELPKGSVTESSVHLNGLKQMKQDITESLPKIEQEIKELEKQE